jgi:hypothetical protein
MSTDGVVRRQIELDGNNNNKYSGNESYYFGEIL